MQANRRVYGLGAVGRLLLTDRSGPDARFIVVETPRKGDPGSQPPGIGGMSDKAWGATDKLGADDNEGLLTHSHAGARDAISQQLEGVGAIERVG
jgi:hypothetical protein